MEGVLTVTGGMTRTRWDVYKLPDLIVIAPLNKQKIEIFENTLDSNFKVKTGGISHKQMQILGCFNSLLVNYPGVPIVFNIRCPRKPGTNAMTIMNNELYNARKKAKELAKGRTPPQIVEIIWRYG